MIVISKVSQWTRYPAYEQLPVIGRFWCRTMLYIWHNVKVNTHLGWHSPRQRSLLFSLYLTKIARIFNPPRNNVTSNIPRHWIGIRVTHKLALARQRALASLGQKAYMVITLLLTYNITTFAKHPTDYWHIANVFYSIYFPVIVYPRGLYHHTLDSSRRKSRVRASVPPHWLSLHDK